MAHGHAHKFIYGIRNRGGLMGGGLSPATGGGGYIPRQGG